jgi:Kef-type K+ transport system membrane component KefB
VIALDVVTGIALLLIIAFIGYRMSFTRLRLPLGARFVFLTGTEFLFVGLALGEEFIGILDLATVRSLTPVFTLGLGFIGLTVGLQLEGPKLARFPGRYLRMTLAQAVVTMVVVFWPCRLLLDRLFPSRDEEVFVAGLVLAATASCTGPAALALIAREFRIRGGRLLDLLRYVSGLDSVIAIAVFGAAFCFVRSPADPTSVALLDGLFLSLTIGVSLGFLLHLLTRVRCTDEELTLFVIGTVVFAGGVATYLRLSPLFVGMVLGTVATNLPGSKLRIQNLLTRLEKPLYLIFLVLAGAIWRPASELALPLAALYVALRVAGKLLGGFVAARSAGRSRREPPAMGLGLIPQGGVVIAMIMSFHQSVPGATTGFVATAVLLGVVVNELAGPWLAVVLLRREKEIAS